MEDRTDLPRIKPREKPSIFNEGMTDGIWTGWLFGSWGFLLSPSYHVSRGWFAVEAAFAAVCGIFGGLEGKRKQEQAQREGRLVSNPTYLNLGLLNGAAVAYIGTLAAQMLPVHIPEAPTVATLGYLGCMAVGSVIRHNVLKRDFDDAVRKQRDDYMLQRTKTLEPTPTLSVSTMPQLEQAEPSPKKSHTERLQQAETISAEHAL